MSTIKRHAFSKSTVERGTCSNRLKLESEKLRLIQDIRLVSSLGLPTPKANDKLAKIQTRLNDCLLCRGDCECGK